MKVEECRNCKVCRPTQLAHEGKGFFSTTSSISANHPTFCATSTPTSGPLNICISNNCSELEIKFELAGGTLFNLNFPRASIVSGTTSTCSAAVPSPFGSTSSGATTFCGTSIPSPFGRAPFEAATFASPLENPPAGINTTCETTCQSQFRETPCQTNDTPCGMRYPTGTAVTFIVGGTPCTTCYASPLIFHTPQVGSYTETPAKISLPHFKEEPHPQCTGSKIVAYSPTAVLDSSSVVSVVYIQSMSAMPAYNNKSVEELRWEDYRLGHEGELKSGSKPTEVPRSDPPTKPSIFTPLKTSMLKFPNAPPGFGFHAFGTSSDNSTSLPFHTSSNIFSTRTPPSTFRSSFTSGVNSTAPLFSSMSSPMSIPSNQSCPRSFSNPTTNVFGKPQDSGTVAYCIFGTPPVSTFGTSNSTASTSSVAASRVISCGLPMTIPFGAPFGASTPCPFSNSTATSVFDKPQMSGLVAPCTFGTPHASEFGNSSTASSSSISSCAMSSTSKSKATSVSSAFAFDKNQLFGSAPSSAPSFGSEPLIGWTPPASGTVAPCAFGTPPSPEFGNSSTASSSSISGCVMSSTSKSKATSVSSAFAFDKNQLLGSAPSSAPSFGSEPLIRWTPPAFGQSRPFGNTSPNLFAEPSSSSHVQQSINPFSVSWGGTSTRPSTDSGENPFNGNFNVMNPMDSGQPTPSISTGFWAKPVTSGASGINDVSDAFIKVTLEQQGELKKVSPEHGNA